METSYSSGAAKARARKKKLCFALFLSLFLSFSFSLSLYLSIARGDAPRSRVLCHGAPVSSSLVVVYLFFASKKPLLFSAFSSSTFPAPPLPLSYDGASKFSTKKPGSASENTPPK